MGSDLQRRLLANVHLEIIPLKGALEKTAAIAAGSVVTVTASPSKGIDHTVDLAVDLQARGFEAVPHLSARMIVGRQQLAEIVSRLDGAGVRRVFVVGGDPEPRGEFHDALGLLEAMADLGHPFSEVGIAGYPEGHPSIPDDRLRKAILEKASHATYIATQMCFSPQAIVDWVRSVRSDGVGLPVRVGVPGAVDTKRLVTVAGRIGVGDSLRFLAKNRGLLRLLRPGRYRPDRLIRRLASTGDGLGLEGLHVFTFNQVDSTVAWHRRALSRLR